MGDTAVRLEMVPEEVPFADRFGCVATLGAAAVEFWTWWETDLEAGSRNWGHATPSPRRGTGRR